MKILAIDIGGTNIKSGIFVDDKICESFSKLTDTKEENLLLIL